MDIWFWISPIISFITSLLNFSMWHFFCSVESNSSPVEHNRLVVIAVAFLLFFRLLGAILRSILDQIDSSYGTPVLEQHNRDYKIILGCITFGTLVPLCVFSMFEVNSTISNLFFIFCSAVPITFFDSIINPALKHSNLDSTRMNRVASNMMPASIASVLFTLMLIRFKTLNMLTNNSTYLLQQVAWILTNFPYYIGFWEVMTEHLNLRTVRNGNEVERDSPNILISSEDLQCNVCLLQYSDKRVCLVLTNCGHSLCEECCEATQQQNVFGRLINCPFCRTHTPGSIEKLPKNYTVMGIVQKIGRVK